MESCPYKCLLRSLNICKTFEPSIQTHMLHKFSSILDKTDNIVTVDPHPHVTTGWNSVSTTLFRQSLGPLSPPFPPSLVAQLVKNLPAMQETWLQFLGWEDPLDKEMAFHSSILAWKIPWTEESGGLRPWVRHDLATKPPPLPITSP